MAPSTAEKTKRSAPSRVLSATLPVKPSVTMTSTGEGMKSRPSTLPTKFSVARRAQELVGGLHERGALGRLLADREQPDLGGGRRRSARST